MFNLAQLFVKIKADDSALQAQLGGIRSQLSGTGVALGTMFGNVATSAIFAATRAVSDFFVGGLKGAMGMQDAMNKTGTVFGDNASVITDRAAQLASSGKAVETEYINAATNLGAVFKNLGDSQEDAVKLGVKLGDLALDMRSLEGAGTTTQDAIVALRAAFRGEYDTIERFRVTLTAATVAQEAVNMGLAKNKDNVSTNARAHAALNMIMKQTTDAQGDMDKTWASADNQTLGFTNTITNLAAKMGELLIPAYSQVISGTLDFALSLRDSFAANKDSITSLVDSVFAFVDGFTSGFSRIVTTVGESFGQIGSYFASGEGMLGSYAAFFAENMATIGQIWRNLPSYVEIAALEAMQAVIDFGGQLQGWASQVGGILLLPGQFLVRGIAMGLDATASALSTFFSGLNQLWNAAIQKLAGPIDFLLRPLNDLGKLFGLKGPDVDKAVLGLKDAAKAVDVSGIFKGASASAGDFDKHIGKVREDLNAMGQVKPTEFGQTRIDELQANIARSEAERTERLKAGIDERARLAQATTAAAGKKVSEAAAAKEEQFKSQTTGVADFASKLRESIFSDVNKVQEQQLAAQNRIAAAAEKTAENTAKPALAMLG